jgi:hypothetical protein
MNKIIILLLLVALFIILTMENKTENFSNSGLNMSDRRCMEMVSYYMPHVTDLRKRAQYVARICSPLRKQIIDEDTGNYFNSYGGFTTPVNHMNSKYI